MERILFSLLMVIALLGLAGCGEEQAKKAQEVTFDQLFANPDQYNGRYVTIEGFYFQGWETIVLSENLEDSGYAEGHLIPKGSVVWIEGGLSEEIDDKLYQQQMMGPVERYGKVRISGKFEYGAKYGHAGGYSSQIVPSEVELLVWSPPQ